jgi:hypothetical protein
MVDMFRSRSWSEPTLAIPSSLWADIGIGSGFLTPTPTRLPNGNIRVFGGVRDLLGRSTINWVDLSPITASVLDYSKEPCLDTRNSGDFDTDGAILGDVFPYEDNLAMFYVGFKRYPDVKFRAYAGFAVSFNLGVTWEKQLSPITELQQRVNNSDIFAVHNVSIANGYIELLVALGDGWEEINSKSFPRYGSFLAHGKTFDVLEISTEVLLPQNPAIYRLGRPRYFGKFRNNTEYIVATGGKRNGDYRPYIFEKNSGVWEMSDLQFPILPGTGADFSSQVSYPANIEINNSTWIFFGGDEMGKSGSYLIRSNDKVST